MGAVVRGGSRLRMDALHGRAEVLARPGPARGVDAGRAAERTDAEAAVIRQRRQPARPGGRLCLQSGIAGESRLRFIRLGQAESAGRYHMDVPRLQQRPDLGELARVVARQHQTRTRLRAGEPSAGPRASGFDRDVLRDEQFARAEAGQGHQGQALSLGEGRPSRRSPEPRRCRHPPSARNCRRHRRPYPPDSRGRAPARHRRCRRRRRRPDRAGEPRR